MILQNRLILCTGSALRESVISREAAAVAQCGRSCSTTDYLGLNHLASLLACIPLMGTNDGFF